MSVFSEQKINLAITLGDPASIGSEILLKALYNKNLTSFANLTIIGSRLCLKQIYTNCFNKSIF